MLTKDYQRSDSDAIPRWYEVDPCPLTISIFLSYGVPWSIYYRIDWLLYMSWNTIQCLSMPINIVDNDSKTIIDWNESEFLFDMSTYFQVHKTKMLKSQVNGTQSANLDDFLTYILGFVFSKSIRNENRDFQLPWKTSARKEDERLHQTVCRIRIRYMAGWVLCFCVSYTLCKFKLPTSLHSTN